MVGMGLVILLPSMFLKKLLRVFMGDLLIGVEYTYELMSFLLMTCSLYQAVLETVARVKPKKNESKEEKYAPLSCRLIGLLVFLQEITDF